MAPAVEGALAPDPAARSRAEPLREIPGLKKRERTWKEEVRDRVRDRKRHRAGDGELPLFRDADAADEAEEVAGDGGSDRVGEAAMPARGHPSLLDEPAEPSLASTRVELGTEEADLPLRGAEPTSAPSSSDLRLAAPESSSGRRVAATEAAPDRRLAGAAEPRPRARARETAEEWSPGGEVVSRPRPLERPAYSGERARAALLDLALLAVLWAVVVYFASRAAHVGLAGLRPAWPYLAGYLAFLGLTYAGYFTGTTGQTLGKIATGLRVVDAAGRPPSYVRAFTRAALGSLGVALAGAGLIPMLLDPARRALHDRLVKTRVVKS